MDDLSRAGCSLTILRIGDYLYVRTGFARNAISFWFCGLFCGNLRRYKAIPAACGRGWASFCEGSGVAKIPTISRRQYSFSEICRIFIAFFFFFFILIYSTIFGTSMQLSILLEKLLAHRTLEFFPAIVFVFRSFHFEAAHSNRSIGSSFKKPLDRECLYASCTLCND